MTAELLAPRILEPETVAETVGLDGEREWSEARQKVAARLLKASRDKSFDPDVDVEWHLEPEPGKFYLCEHHVSLYGTPLWEQLTLEQRVELSKHESASWLSAGIAFEMQLDAFLLKHSFIRNPLTDHVRYALTEIADECRHSIMFSRMIEKMGTPVYNFDPRLRRLMWAAQGIATEIGAFIGTLIVEEFLDSAQREIMRDDSVQTVVRQVTSIHVVEEARHVSYARAELARRMERVSPAHRAALRLITAGQAQGIYRMLVDPRVYDSVGLDRKVALQAARTSAARYEFRRRLTARTYRFFDEIGLIGGRSAAMWRSWGHGV